MKKKILLVTVNRSDFGIQKKLIKKLKSDNSIKFELIVTGSHYDSRFGLTYKEILREGFKIDNKIVNKSNNYDTSDVANILSKGIYKFFNIYKKKRPDLLIILGDRYEMFAAALPTILLGIPVAHIHGGEITLGSFDNYFRNMITQISKLHFTCHNVYKNRVVRMIGSNSNIFNYGALSVENIKNEKFLNKKQLEKKFHFSFSKKNILVTYHPETMNSGNEKKKILTIFNSFKKFPEINFFFTSSAPDPKNNDIIRITKKFCKENNNYFFIKSFGRKYYFSMLQKVDCVFGNSSSGIIEAPSFKVATINIGNRQKGRELSKTVINCNYDKNQIIKSINKIYTQSFRKLLKNTNNIFYKKSTSEQIIKKIKFFLNNE